MKCRPRSHALPPCTNPGKVTASSSVTDRILGLWSGIGFLVTCHRNPWSLTASSHTGTVGGGCQREGTVTRKQKSDAAQSKLRPPAGELEGQTPPPFLPSPPVGLCRGCCPAPGELYFVWSGGRGVCSALGLNFSIRRSFDFFPQCFVALSKFVPR